MFGMGTGVASSELPPGKTNEARAVLCGCAVIVRARRSDVERVWDHRAIASTDLTSSRRVAIARVATGSLEWSSKES